MATIKTQSTYSLANNIAQNIRDMVYDSELTSAAQDVMWLQSELYMASESLEGPTGTVTDGNEDGSYLWKATIGSSSSGISETYKNAPSYYYDDGYYNDLGEMYVTGTSSMTLSGPLGAPTKVSGSDSITITQSVRGYTATYTEKNSGSGTLVVDGDVVTLTSLNTTGSGTELESGFYIYSPQDIYGGATYTGSWSDSLKFSGAATSMGGELLSLTVKSLTYAESWSDKSDGSALDSINNYDSMSTQQMGGAYEHSGKASFALASSNGLSFSESGISGQLNSLQYSLQQTYKSENESGGQDESYQSSNSSVISTGTLNDILGSYYDDQETVVDQLASELLKDSDTIIATGSYGAYIEAYTGNDKVTGSNYSDTVYGDGGNDSLLGGLGNDELYGGQGNDSLDGGDGNDFLGGGMGADTLRGGNGNDQIYDFDESDTSELASNDSLDGGSGNDVLRSGLGNDTLLGGLGNDALFDYADNNLLNGGAGNDLLATEDGNDTLIGDVGNDVLSAGAGNDVLDGGVGNDVLVGGAGQDAMTGGSGLDVFSFLGADAGITASTMDLIKDFSLTQDQLYFDFSGNIGTVGMASSYDQLLTAADAAASGNYEQILIGYTSTDSYVLVDTDYSGSVDMAIKLVGVKGSEMAMGLLQNAISTASYDYPV